MVKKVFQVKGMQCSSCAMEIESIEDDLPGIKRLKASYHKGRMEVEYDESEVSVVQIVAAVKLRGYEAVLLGS
jgi:copper chaperone CopZ